MKPAPLFPPKTFHRIRLPVNPKEREVEWVRAQFEIWMPERPRPGGQFWSQAKPTFNFVDGVAEEFGLWQCFARHMPNPFAALRGPVP